MTAAPRVAVFANLAVDLGAPLAQEGQLLLKPSPWGRPGQLPGDLGPSFVGSWYSSTVRGRRSAGYRLGTRRRRCRRAWRRLAAFRWLRKAWGDDFGGPAGQLGPGGRLAVTELLARVGGSSVTANCPCADQGGRNVDMVVGADHRGRACVGVWRDATARPLTALRQRRGHGRRSCWTRPTAWRRGRVQASGRSPPPALPGPPGAGTQPGLGPVLLGHREQFVVGRPRGSASRSDVWSVSGLHPAIAPRTGEVLQGTWPAPPA